MENIVISQPGGDITGTEKTLTIPAGKTVLTWTVTTNALIQALGGNGRIIPVIGDQSPTSGMFINASTGLRKSFSGTWSTTTLGGEVSVRLRMEAVQGDFVFGGMNQPVSWTLVVYPEEASGIPAIGGVGLGILIATLVAAGGWILSRRKGFARAT